MELLNLLEILARKSVVIIFTTVIVLVVVTVGTLFLPPVYEATSLLRISATTGGSLNYYDSTYADRLFTSFTEIASSDAVQSQLLETLEIESLPDISVEKIPNSELFKITVKAQSPKLAAASANSLAQILLKNSRDYYIGDTKSAEEIIREQLETTKIELEVKREEYQAELLSLDPEENIKAEITKEQLDEKKNTYDTLLNEYYEASFREEVRENSVSIVSEAKAPAAPSSPNLKLNLVVGLVAGLVGGAGIALVLENLDTSLNTDQALNKTVQLPVFAQIPKLSLGKNGLAKSAETFNKIAQNILYASKQENLKTILFTSTQKGEGKTTIIVNLARSLAELNKKVLLIDADQYTPMLHNYFLLPNDFGFSNILSEETPAEKAILSTEDEHIKVIPAGSLSTNGYLYSPDKANEILRELQKDFDYILIDSSPMFPLTHIAHLVNSAEGILLVIRRTYSEKIDVEDANQYLSEITNAFTGVIFNQAQNATNNYIHHKT